ncbi:hypothetical protein B0J18DRAFT_371621 [Chaetomium sp. MPI-SDFR-AT-0129]|nr:hypothetical protein B0J18DRAFT_371621 [Chaetomium sp. MPI-SDFR-AT-0129]
MSLFSLPYELMALVLTDLDLNDIRNLSYTCFRLRFIVYELNITKQLLETHGPYTIEARDARVTGDYGTGLRRLIKRRDAIASVSPYLVSILGFCYDWIYENGVLCYTSGRELCVLNLHRSSKTESVVDPWKVIQTEEFFADVPCKANEPEITLLYFAQGILSFKYTLQTPSGVALSYILSLRPLEGMFVTATILERTSKEFVRNDDRFIYYGYLYGWYIDREPEIWTIRSYNIKTGSWAEERINPSQEIGTDIGITVCFEVFDGYLYGVSSVWAAQRTDWNSYYTCFRSSFDDRGTVTFTFPGPSRKLWRRDNKSEGTIDNT